MNNDEKRRRRRKINNIDHDVNTIWTRYGVDSEGARSKNKAAEIYERHLVLAMFKPLARDLIQSRNIRRSDRILDVTCGTGIVARLATDYVDRTVGKVVVSSIDDEATAVGITKLKPRSDVPISSKKVMLARLILIRYFTKESLIGCRLSVSP